MFACWSDAARRISRSKRVGGHRRRELGREHLHHHLASEAVLVGDEHARHAAAAELALDRVTTGQRILNARSEVGHVSCVGRGLRGPNLR